MRVAFYAPLKPPDHPVPSGDRQIARHLVQALRMRGHVVTLASRFRSFDGAGDASRQSRLEALGARLAERFVARCTRAPDRPQLWFTYHVYHKAPDLIGPRVSRALDIPYVVAEASVAPKQSNGPWAAGHARALEAVRVADAVVFLNPIDVGEVARLREPGAAALVLPPFLDVEAFAGPRNAASPRTPAAGPVRLVTVAMMRPGAKLASYRVLASALGRIASLPWEMTIVGDGRARPEVEALFAALPRGRIRFVGARASEGVAAALRDADVFVWPAIDEAFGMAFVEAQACGLPVVGGDTGGVSAVVAQGRSGWLVPPGDADAFAEAIRGLIVDASLRERMAAAALDYVRERHDISVAATALDRLLQRIVAAHCADAPRGPS